MAQRRQREPLSRHCGPLLTSFGERPGIDVGKRSDVRGAVPAGAPILYGIDLFLRSLGPDVVSLTEVFDPCLDLSGFDPIARPWQTSVPVASWSPADRTLTLSALLLDPFAPTTVWIQGVRAGAPTASCCNTGGLRDFHGCPFLATLCLPVDPGGGCDPVPDTARGLAARKGSIDRPGSWPLPVVTLLWDPVSSADHHNAWRMAERERIPRAGKEASVDEPVTAVCTTTLAECVDPSAFESGTPDLLFYQVRADCADGSEGPI